MYAGHGHKHTDTDTSTRSPTVRIKGLGRGRKEARVSNSKILQTNRAESARTTDCFHKGYTFICICIYVCVCIFFLFSFPLPLGGVHRSASSTRTSHTYVQKGPQGEPEEHSGKVKAEPFDGEYSKHILLETHSASVVVQKSGNKKDEKDQPSHCRCCCLFFFFGPFRFGDLVAYCADTASEDFRLDFASWPVILWPPTHLKVSASQSKVLQILIYAGGLPLALLVSWPGHLMWDPHPFVEQPPAHMSHVCVLRVSWLCLDCVCVCVHKHLYLHRHWSVVDGNQIFSPQFFCCLTVF